jgi:hypothetical protein
MLAVFGTIFDVLKIHCVDICTTPIISVLKGLWQKLRKLFLKVKKYRHSI